MRIAIMGRQIAGGLVALLLGLVSYNATAGHFEFPLAATGDASQAWICRYTVAPDTAWYMRCHDLQRILEDDPVLNEHQTAHSATMIPLWGAPFDDHLPRQLARATLCRPEGLCTVTLAARHADHANDRAAARFLAATP